MNFDGNAKSQPVFVENLEHHDDLMKAFDRITYYKVRFFFTFVLSVFLFLVLIEIQNGLIKHKDQGNCDSALCAYKTLHLERCM